MKKPSLKKIKKHFKNAKTVRCLSTGKEENIVLNITENYNYAQDSWWIRTEESAEGFGSIELFSKELGYAEILTYKEKTFSITESQIKELVQLTHQSKRNEEKLKEWFPEAFETKHLPDNFTGWCRINLTGNEKYLMFFENGIIKYGFDGWGKWDDGSRLDSKIRKDNFEATESEVFEALKNEAVKRGFLDGIWFKGCAGHQKDEILQIKGIKFASKDSGFQKSNIGLYDSEANSWIFNGGKWAEIIETITRSEAEKQLNKKIIN